MTLDEIRRANLRTVISEIGGVAALATKIGASASQVSQWVHAAPDSKTGKPRGMSHDTCRRIEVAGGKPRGWMDTDPALVVHLSGANVTQGATVTSGAIQQAPAPRPPDLAEALPVVLDALAGLTPGRWAMVRARLDSLPEHPEMRDDVVADVLPLLQPAAPAAKRRAEA